MAATATVKAVLFLSFIAFSGARQFQDFLDAWTRLLQNKNWNDLEDVLPGSNVQQLLQTFDINSTLQQLLVSNAISSDECLTDLQFWQRSLTKKELWAIQSE